MKTVAIIQAHVGSSRLHGKVLRDLAGQPMLARVIQRAQRMRLVDQVVVATTTLPADNPIIKLCDEMHVPYFRGSESDVLERFLGAAREFGADTCVRITSDCPLIDPSVSDYIIARFHSIDPAVDYCSNKIPQSYPRGLDTEVFSLVALERAHVSATHSYERAHVTIHMYENPQNFRLCSVTDDVDRAHWRWTVDAADDLAFVNQVYHALGADGNFGWRDVLRLMHDQPELMQINAHIQQKNVKLG